MTLKEVSSEAERDIIKAVCPQRRFQDRIPSWVKHIPLFPFPFIQKDSDPWGIYHTGYRAGIWVMWLGLASAPGEPYYRIRLYRWPFFTGVIRKWKNMWMPQWLYRRLLQRWEDAMSDEEFEEYYGYPRRPDAPI